MQELLSPWFMDCLPTWKLPKPPTLGTSVEGSSCRHDQLLVPFPAPLPAGGGHGRAENSKLLTMAWSF